MKISDFVIGLGFDTSEFEKGMKTASNDLGGFRSDILQIGSTMAGVFGAKSLTIDFAKSNDQLRQMAQMLNVNANELYGLTEASKSFGASEGEIGAVLSNLAQSRAEFDRLGKIGIFEDLALIGVDFDAINSAKDDVQALYILANQISRLDARGQMMASNILGLTPQMLDLLKNGGDGVRILSEAMQQARPHTEEMAKASRELISEWNYLMVNLGGRADQFATPLVSSLAEITKSTNDWFDANQKVIDQNIGAFVGYVGNNLNLIAPIFATIAGSGVVATFAGLARYVPIVGGAISAVSMGLSRFIPVIGALSLFYELFNFDAEKFEKLTGFKAPEWLFSTGLQDNNFFNPEIGAGGKLLTQTDFMDERFFKREIGSNNIGSGGIGSNTKESNINLTVELDGEILAQKNVKLLNDGLESSASNVQSMEDR